MNGKYVIYDYILMFQGCQGPNRPSAIVLLLCSKYTLHNKHQNLSTPSFSPFHLSISLSSLASSTQPLLSNTQTGALKIYVHTILTTYVTFLVTNILEFVQIICLKNNKYITQFILETRQQPALSQPTKNITLTLAELGKGASLRDQCLQFLF